MKTKEYRAQVRCAGIKKRCRKIDSHNFMLGYYKLSHNIEELKSMATTILERKMKSYQKPRLTLDLVELEKNNSFEQIVHWSPFDEETKRLSKDIPLEISH